ncbi:unnamed protein product [Ophioblennius macclurei]
MIPLTPAVFILVVISTVKGWECNAGCNPENGFCEKAGKCRCKPGWRGENCEQCVTFPGCLHGRCEKAWQCMCEDGWVGSLCDRDTRLCSSSPCTANATCIDTGERGYLCICPSDYTGENCHLKKGLCLTKGSPCQNGGTCSHADGSSCLCPLGFSGVSCEVGPNNCQPNPCLNGGSCTAHGLAFTCLCPPGFTGFTCDDMSSLSACAGLPCANQGTCVGQSDGTFHCLCQKRFTGPTCSLQHRPHSRAKGLALKPQHYSLPAHAFQNLLRPSEQDLLRIALKETVHSSGVMVTHAQLVCLSMLALLTCLVILGTTAIVFFGHCETWLANAKYSQLVRQQREHRLRGSRGSQEELDHSVHIILPEKIRFSSFGRHYTSI